MHFGLIIAGFFAGLIDSMVGGGGLISVPALMTAGLPPHFVLGSNKVVAVATSTASSVRYGIAKIVRWQELIPLMVVCYVGSAAGAFGVTLVKASVLRPLILVLLIVASALVFLKDRLLKGKESSLRPRWLFLSCALISLYDGFFGPGGGTFLMAALLFFNADNFLSAAAKGRWLNLATSLGALSCFAYRGVVNYQVAFPIAGAALVGGLVGSSIAVRGGVRLIRPLFFAVTWALILKIGLDILR